MLMHENSNLMREMSKRTRAPSMRTHENSKRTCENSTRTGAQSKRMYEKSKRTMEMSNLIMGNPNLRIGTLIPGIENRYLLSGIDNLSKGNRNLIPSCIRKEPATAGGTGLQAGDRQLSREKRRPPE
jgi:hypothetical protein